MIAAKKMLDKRIDGLLLFLMEGHSTPLAQDDIKHRSQKQSKQSDAEHSRKHRDASGLSHLASGPVPKKQRNRASDEGDRGHDDGTETEMAGFEGGFYRAHAMDFKFAGKLDDENCILAGKSHQHHQTDLNEDVVVTARKPNTKESSEDADRNDQDDRQGKSPALIEGSQNEEHKQDCQWEDDSRGAALIGLLIR